MELDEGVGAMRHLLPAALLLAACAAELDTADPAALSEGTPEAVGVLRFLNGPAADVITLDVDAALDVRAARNIVAHVRGADGVLATSDDDLLGSIGELDGISQVGPATIDRLVAYVDSIGGVPRIDVEGVLMTDAEAAAVLAAAQGATTIELDDDAGLDARAARNIVAARPLADLSALAAVSYVGATALDKLRRWAPGWTPSAPACDPVLLQELRDCVEREIVESMVTLTDAVAVCLPMEQYASCVERYQEELATLCRADNDCLEPARCVGIPADGSSVLGECVQITDVPGAGLSCSATAPCGAGLVCAGITLEPTGTCSPAWMAGSFAVEIPAAIPSTAGATATSQVVVRGLATVPVDIEVELALSGVDPRRIRLELTDSNGDTAVLWNGAVDGGALPARLVARAGIPRDDSVNGMWTLAAITLASGAAGQIDGWTLHLTSRWD